jgi:hypothetical protein
MKPTDAGTERYSPDTAKRDHATHRRKRNVDKDQCRGAHRTQGEVKHDEDQQHRNRQHDHQAVGGALLIFELPAPDDAVSRRQLHIGANVRFGFLDIADEIAARNERLH